jgi:hypothetical protein
MGKINILNDAGTNKLSLEFNGTSDTSVNLENAVTTDTNGYVPVAQVPYLGRRNLIINGGFDVWQRGNLPDRWQSTAGMSVDNTIKTHMKFTTTSADPYQWYKVEDIGRRLAGKVVTLSLWGKCSDGGNAIQYIDYEHSSAMSPYWATPTGEVDSDGFHRYEITFSLESSNGGEDPDWHSFRFEWRAVSGITIEIKEVQLELGSVATPFEHRSYGEELALCQRYYQIHYCAGSGVQNSATSAFAVSHLPVTMRDRPTLGTRSGGWTNINLEHDDTYDVTSGVIAHGSAAGDPDSMSSFVIDFVTSGSNTVGYAIVAVCDRNDDYFTYDAEL